MKTVICTAILLLFASCPQKRVVHHRPVSHASKSRVGVIEGNQNGVLVESSWIQKYRDMENGNSIPEDNKIYMEGDKYRIPQAVADHFADMVKKQ